MSDAQWCGVCGLPAHEHPEGELCWAQPPDGGLRAQLAAERALADRLADALDLAWAVIANASDWDHDDRRPEWRLAAELWRDNAWHPLLAAHAAARRKEGE